MKPEKTIYENQKEIHEKIVSKIKRNYLKYMKELYLIGSLVDGKFGKYAEQYEGYYGSDVDLVGIPITIPKEWKYEGEFYNWNTKYTLGEVKIKKTVHPIIFQVPFNQNIELFWEKVKELNWQVEKLK